MLNPLTAHRSPRTADRRAPSAERRIHLTTKGRSIERLRRARALIGSIDALERFGAWRAPEER